MDYYMLPFACGKLVAGVLFAPLTFPLSTTESRPCGNLMRVHCYAKASDAPTEQRNSKQAIKIGFRFFMVFLLLLEWMHLYVTAFAV